MTNKEDLIKYISKNLLWVETQITHDVAIDAKEVKYVLCNILTDIKSGLKDNTDE